MSTIYSNFSSNARFYESYPNKVPDTFKKKIDSKTFLFSDDFYTGNIRITIKINFKTDTNIRDRKVSSIEEIFSALFLSILLLELQRNINTSYQNNPSSTFNFKPRYTRFKDESTYKPEAESTYKPKPKPKPKTNNNDNVRTNRNINTEEKNALKTLGLADKNINKITLKDINAAYRKNALKYHPDKNNEAGAAAKFLQMTEARDVLLAYTKKTQ